MKITVLILACLFYGCANAQVKTLDLKHGKYLENAFKKDFIGNWRSTHNDFKIGIIKEKKHIKRNTMDVYVDVLNIRITSFINKGTQLADKFTSNLALLSLGSDDFNGIYRDTITSNNVQINLKRVDNNKLLFTVKLPE